MDSINKTWEQSHNLWWRADELRLQKLNRARGFSNEGLSLSDDDPLLKNVPIELRVLLPLSPAPVEASTMPDAEHPASAYFSKLELDRLCGDSSTPPEHDGTDWLSKLLSTLPAPTHHDDGGLLRKKTDLMLQSERLVDKVREFCIGDEEERLEKGLRCMDFSLVTEMVQIIIERVKAERALAA